MPDRSFDIEVRFDEEVALGVCSDTIADWGWWWVTDDLKPRATFRQQVRALVASDSSVNDEVHSLDRAVTTSVGSLSNAVILEYVVELGERGIVGAGGTVIDAASILFVAPGIRGGSGTRIRFFQ